VLFGLQLLGWKKFGEQALAGPHIR
jgi:hypothetical protein